MVGVLEKVLKNGFSGTHMHIESVNDALGHNSPYRISKKKKKMGEYSLFSVTVRVSRLGL